MAIFDRYSFKTGRKTSLRSNRSKRYQKISKISFLSVMEIELNFRFDANGRTANTSQSANESIKEGDNDASMDYSSKSVMTNIGQLPEQIVDDLLFDCEISDSGLMPRTFWVPVKGMKPRCTLEQFALDVFHHHVPANLDYDRSKSGAEW